MSLPQPDHSEIYTNGYDEPVLNFMRRRSLGSHGFFIEPFLKAGLRILDLGCGPGTMTIDLARKVGPKGSVVGVDYHDQQFDRARAAAGDLPVSFRAMDAYRLDLEAESFDGVFSHALFEHLARPVDALKECKRVLKPGGFIGLRSPDWGGNVLYPWDERIEKALQARLDLQRRNGGEVYAGRRLGPWLREAGFDSVTVSGSYEVYPDTRLIVEHLASQLEQDGQSAHAQACRAWGENSEATFAQAWFAATGFKSTKG